MFDISRIPMEPSLSLALWRAVGARADLPAALRTALELLGPKLPATAAAIRLQPFSMSSRAVA